MGWQDSRDANDGAGGGGLFLKLNSGDKATVVFRGEPLTERSYWDNSKGHSVLLEPGEEAPKDSEGEKITHKLNVYVVEDNDTKIMQLNAPTFDLVDSVMQEIGEDAFFAQKIVIKRDGTGLKTRYKVIAVGPLDADAFEDMRSQPLHELLPSAR